MLDARPVYWLRQLGIAPTPYDAPVRLEEWYALRCGCGWFTRAERGSPVVVCRSCGRVNDGSLVAEVV